MSTRLASVLEYVAIQHPHDWFYVSIQLLFTAMYAPSLQAAFLVCRTSFPQLRGVAQRVVQNISAHGAETPIDMDLLCAQLSWDIIGMSFVNRTYKLGVLVLVCQAATNLSHAVLI